MREGKKQEPSPLEKPTLLFTRFLRFHCVTGRGKGGKAAVGAGTLPVWVQGRSVLPAGGCRREAKQLQ